MQIIQFYNELNKKIRQTQLKIDSIIIRLQQCQLYIKNMNLYSQSERSNPFEPYINNYASVSSTPNKPENRISNKNIKWYSMSEQSKRDKINSMRENILDQKSFGLIKKSILINSEQIQQMRQKIIDFQYEYSKRLLNVEEGVQILTRLSSMLQTKINDHTETIEILVQKSIIQIRQKVEDKKKDHKSRSKQKLIKKYLPMDFPINQRLFQSIS